MSKPELAVPEPFIDEPDLTYVMQTQAEFHKLFNVPINSALRELYVTLIEEEHEEWIEEYYTSAAPYFMELKELSDLLYVTAGLAHQMGLDLKKADKYRENKIYSDSITNFVEAIATGHTTPKIISNLIYCLYGYANWMKWDLNEAYKRVHYSNCSKLDNEGKPIYREDGKVLKGPNYTPPNLEDLTNGE